MSVRLHRFQASTTATYTLEVGDLYFRFYVTGGQVESTPGTPYEIAHPYADADIAALRFRQINDVIYITHPDYPVGKLSRISNASWTYAVVEFDTVPTLDENVDDITITASNDVGTITLEASSAIFDALHVGSYWRIGYKRKTGSLNLYLAGDVDSNGYLIYGDFNVRTYGIWEATIVLQKRIAVTGGSLLEWETVKEWKGESDRNIDVVAEADEPVEYRLRVQDFVSGTDARVVLEWSDAIIYGTVKITAVGSGTSATATVTETLYSEAGLDIADHPTKYWAEGAWSDYRGYPRVCCVHEQRLVFGGTYYQPATIWGSVTGDFENFLYGVADDAAWAFQLASEELNTIQWIESLNVLVIGTDTGEWRGRGNDLGDSITPTRRDFKQRTFFGSEYLPAIKVGDSTVLFVERKGRKIRELFVNGDMFETADLTLLSEHVTLGGVVQMAWQGDRRILWVVTAQGDLYGLTYDREQDVAGWHGPHTTEGTYGSVCTVYGQSGSDDEVWVIVTRIVGSSSVVFVERFDPTQWTAKADAFMVDAGLTYEGSPETDFTGADHLAGLACVGTADGIPFAATVDGAGAFSLPTGFDPASVVHIGLSYVSEASPYRMDVDPQAGVTAGKIRRITSLHARLLDTIGGSKRASGDTAAKALEYASADGSADPALFSGDVEIDFQTGHEYDPTITIRQAEPLPMTLTGLIVGTTVSST